MKTTKRLFVLLVSSVFLFSSCLKNDNVKQPDSPSNNGFGVIIPDGFDWSNSFDVKCDFNIKSDKLAKVKLFMAKEGEPFATFFVGNDVENVSVTVPNYVKKLYVSYLKEDVLSERTEIAVVNNKLVYTVPADAKDFTEAEPAPLERKATRAGKGNEGKYDSILIPSTGDWGTVLFEDNWPSYGDYDFNDFVLGYKIKLEPNNKNKIKSLTIDMIIRAEGGTLPYEMALLIDGVKGSDYKGIEINKTESIVDEIKVTQVEYANYKQNPLILHFTREQLESKKFYNNTEKNKITSDKDLYQVSFELELNAVDHLKGGSFDFFLIKDDGDGKREIHLKDWDPTPTNRDYNQGLRKIGGKTTDKSQDFYLSDENFVWGVKVDAPIPHSVEYVNIKESYPNFINWIVDGDDGWYLAPDESKVIKWN